MATAATTIANSAQPDQPLILVNLSYCRTLTPLTYLTWASQITSILFGLDLLKFVDATHPKPEATITTTTPAVAATTIEPAKPVATTVSPNPPFITWTGQDRLLLVALIATTSHEAWEILKTTYANPSCGQILQLKDNLDNLTKNNLSISDYLQAIKSCTNKIAILGKPMDVEDIIAKILKGLDYDSYKPVIDSIRACDTPITFEALHEKLIHH